MSEVQNNQSTSYLNQSSSLLIEGEWNEKKLEKTYTEKNILNFSRNKHIPRKSKTFRMDPLERLFIPEADGNFGVICPKSIKTVKQY